MSLFYRTMHEQRCSKLLFNNKYFVQAEGYRRTAHTCNFIENIKLNNKLISNMQCLSKQAILLTKMLITQIIIIIILRCQRRFNSLQKLIHFINILEWTQYTFIHNYRYAVWRVCVCVCIWYLRAFIRSYAFHLNRKLLLDVW